MTVGITPCCIAVVPCHISILSHHCRVLSALPACTRSCCYDNWNHGRRRNIGKQAHAHGEERETSRSCLGNSASTSDVFPITGGAIPEARLALSQRFSQRFFWTTYLDMSSRLYTGLYHWYVHRLRVRTVPPSRLSKHSSQTHLSARQAADVQGRAGGSSPAPLPARGPRRHSTGSRWHWHSLRLASESKFGWAPSGWAPRVQAHFVGASVTGVSY